MTVGVNLVRVSTSHTGTGGPIPLGAAVPGRRGTEALVDGQAYSYSILNGLKAETCYGVYDAGDEEITRFTVESTEVANAPIDVGSGAEIVFTPSAQDLRTALKLTTSQTTLAATSTCDVSAEPSTFVIITGSTTITSFGSTPNQLVLVEFTDGALITHNATTLQCLTGASVQAGPGDRALLYFDASGNCKMEGFWKGDGTSLKYNDNSIALAKLTNIATDKLVGRVSTGSGAPELVDFTDVGQALVAAADYAAVHTLLSLGSLATVSTINNSNWSGTELSLANGGTGASLADPNADRIMFWDDSANAIAWLTVGTGLLITGTSLEAGGGGNITITDAAPMLTLTDSDTGHDSVISSNSTAGSMTIMADANNEAANTLLFLGTDGTTRVRIADTHMSPNTNDSLALGNTSLGWSDLFMATGGVINFANGNLVLTHSSGVLTLSVGDLRITSPGTNTASVATYGKIDALFFDNRITQLFMSEALGRAIFSGPDGSAIHDHFDTLTYVDDENATNCNTSEAGCLKPQTSSAGTTVNLNTGSTTTNYGNPFTIVDMSTALTPGDVINEIGVYSTTARTGLKCKIVQRTSANTFTVVADTGSWNHTGASFENKALSSPYTVPATGTFYVAVYYPTSTSVNVSVAVNRATASGVDATGSGVTITESSGNVPPMRIKKNAFTGGNITVASTAIAAATQPSTMRVAAMLYDAVGVALNTDVMIDVSRNNGTNWTTATLTELYTQPGNIRVLDTGNVDVSGQPAGTNLKWRWRTANSVQPKLLGAAMWGSS
jgi:hypothetical protein